MLYYGDIVRPTGRNNCWNFILLGSHQPSHPVPVGWSRDSRIIEAQPIYELDPLELKKFELYFIMEKYISYTCQVWNKTTQGKARSNRRFIARNRMGDKCVWYHLSAYHREINQLTSQNMSWNIRSYSGPRRAVFVLTLVSWNPGLSFGDLL